MMKTVVVLAVVVALAWASCPDDCSGNGSCNSGVCICNDDFGGDDCSIPDKELTNGKVVSDSVSIRQWKFYHISVSNKPELVIEVNQTSTGDCDTYVRLGDYPTKTEYLARDFSTRPTTHLVIPNANGLYYIGVYGFLSTSYNIEAITESDCELECSGHGSCVVDGTTVTCICDQGYIGDDCSVTPPVMSNNTRYHGDIALGEWTYYTIENSLNTVEIYMSQGSSGLEDCDMYVKFGGLPTFSNFDYRDTTTISDHDLKITDASQGNYTYGIYGYKGCSYSTKAITYNECPNQCSGHGTCHDNSCSCITDYDGDACENRTAALTPEAEKTGFVDDGYWNYYYFTVSTSEDAYVNVIYSDSSQDCDLYILRDARPTTTEFDYRDYTFSTNKTIYIEDPDPVATYNIGVYGYKACTYILKYGLTTTCPNGCSNHGTCESGHCLCNEGYGGDDCSDDFGVLQNGVQVDSVLNTFIWRYYTFDVEADFDVTILMKEVNSTGFVWLYESREYFPDAVEYDMADMETNSQVHSIVFAPESAETVYVGVATSPLAVSGVTYGFSLEAYQASFGGRRALQLVEVRK